jgi:hypothetical protein
MHRASTTAFLARTALLSACAALACLAAPVRPACAGHLPPRGVTALLPSASFAPGSTHTIALTVRANGVPANFLWSAGVTGPFGLGLSPASGLLGVGADGTASVPIAVTTPDSALGVSAITITLTREIGGDQLAKVTGAVQAATDGRPEVWPAVAAWSAAAGTAGSVTFQVHSITGSSEAVLFTAGRSNPDPNNAGALFPGGSVPSGATLPGGGTIAVDVTCTIPADAYGGNLNAVQLTVTSATGNTAATGYALAAADGAVATALAPAGLVPLDTPAAGRDGPVELPARGYWLLPAGTSGVRVLGASMLGAIGAIDPDADGIDDRLLGTVRIPSYAAALAVVPGFVAASGDTLDLGLLAAGRAGLMLLDLRSAEDPPFGTWSDFYDVDENGIDDRILRTIPTTGFATDVAWFRAPSGRVVALVADADSGSVPVGAGYDPALAVPGTGAGVVAIDVDAAIDSLGGLPYAAGTLPTPGSALDLEVRGRSAPDLAIADGAEGVSLYRLTASGGAPAAVTFTPLGNAALSAAWGAPYARDLAWISNTGDSAYVAVAAGAGGVQVVRARAGAAPELVLAQQTAAPAVGLAGAWTGTVAAALGSGGVALFRMPPAAELDHIVSGAPAPYVQPVALARLAPWTAGALEVASQQAASSATTALRFAGTAGTAAPDLLVSDGPRVLLLRGGTAAVTAVERATRDVPGLVLGPASPNPFHPSTRFVYELARSARVRLAVYDVSGRLVATLLDRVVAAGRHAAVWDGRDARGREVGSGVYVARIESPAGVQVRKLVLAR